MKLKDFLTDWRSFAKLLLFLVLAVVGIIILSAVMKVWFAYSIYSFFLGWASSTFGLDIVLSRAVAVFTTVIALIILPWIISFILFGRKKKEVLIAGSLIFAIWTLSLYYGTGNVFFDRNTGKPAKYYIKTLAGFKFSSREDFDPQFGIKYKPIDAQTVQEYYLWEKTGKMQVPTVQPGKYFDIITGEPIVWYADRPDGSVELFPLPGYDPLTGQALRPMTKEVAERRRMQIMSPLLLNVGISGVDDIKEEAERQKQFREDMRKLPGVLFGLFIYACVLIGIPLLGLVFIVQGRKDKDGHAGILIGIFILIVAAVFWAVAWEAFWS